METTWQGAWAAHLVSLSGPKSPTRPGHPHVSLCHNYEGNQGPNPQNCLLFADDEGDSSDLSLMGVYPSLEVDLWTPLVMASSLRSSSPNTSEYGFT